MNNPIALTINALAISVEQGTTVAAAIALAGHASTRRSVTGMPRAPVCGMGVCQECRVTIDGHDLRAFDPRASIGHAQASERFCPALGRLANRKVGVSL